MKDIRPDLRERLDALEKRSAILRSQLEQNKEQEELLKNLLQHEDERFGRLEAALVAPSRSIDGDRSGAASTPLAKLIVNTIKQSDHPVTLDDLKRAAEHVKFDFGTKKPGRVLHWALVAMHENNVIERNGAGWKLKVNSALLSGTA